MIKRFFTIATSILFSACQNTQNDNNYRDGDSLFVDLANSKTHDVEFKVAKNYFVKNDIKTINASKFETEESFNNVFGMATTMAKDGKPTKIDFSKQFVIAVIRPETDLDTSMEPVRLEKNKMGGLTLSYQVVIGKKLSYYILPYFAIIVDKTHNGEIELKELK